MLTEKITTTLFILISILWSRCSSQITSTQCFSDRLQRCQQDINNIINSIPVNAPVPEISHHSAHEYGGSGNNNNEMQSKCSAVRGDFDCLLTYTAGCLNSGNNPMSSPYGPNGNGNGNSNPSNSNHANEIYRAKQFLDKYCDHGGSGGWRSTQCFLRGDIRNCESSLTSLASGQPCANFNTFKTCALNYARNNCPSNELAFFSSYIFDKASDQAWQCSPGENYLFPYSSNGINRITNVHGTYVSGNTGMQNTQDRYGGTYSSSSGFNQYPGSNQYPASSGQYGTSFSHGQVGIGQTGYPGNSGSFGTHYQSGSYAGSRPPYDSRYGSSGYDTHGGNMGGSGGIISDGSYPPGSPDRYGGPGQVPSLSGDPSRNYNLFPAENCVERSVYYARSCEDMLLQRQREARNGRTGIDVSRRLCCSLYFYHDCLSKTVIQYCRDASPTTVEIMMGQRKREMAITCRDFSREQCNSASDLTGHMIMTIISLTALFALHY